MRETVNLRALAVYVRLIDLFDLGEDRTPYVVWKFVAPRDLRSRMEWTKHRVLRPVTTTPYEKSRNLVVDGSTDSHEVYAALEDLRIYCETELRGCCDVVARMNDPRHRLDLHHLRWRVAARGFRPVSIRFEFDRERMFEILATDIYDGDPYVFLRELLQNSIDAIRMRREVLRRKGLAPPDFGEITVRVDHREDGDALVTWTDNGIGMDEYVVRNYLAVAGKSYYRSEEFEREGLNIDPISRFGVGILSCFMVAERIEIDTFRDPNFPPAAEPLKIVIPSVKGQFRIEAGVAETAREGTTVRVYVEGKRLPRAKKGEGARDEDGAVERQGEAVQPSGDGVQPLQVIEYLKIVAGFVEFPIVVTEGDRKTVILHPRHDADAARKRFGPDFEIHQLDLRYPWEEVFVPQDLATAREVLKEVKWDIAKDLGLEGCEGSFSYVVPKDEIGPFDIVFGSETSSEVRRPGYPQPQHVRWDYQWRREIWGSTDPRPGLSRSSTPGVAHRVYNAGVLVAGATRSRHFSPLGVSCTPAPQVVANMTGTDRVQTDLSRTRVADDAAHWSNPIYSAHEKELVRRESAVLLATPPARRLRRLSDLYRDWHCSAESLTDAIPESQWPVPLLEPGGRIVVRLLGAAMRSGRVYLFPQIAGDTMAPGFRSLGEGQGDSALLFPGWAGDWCLAIRWPTVYSRYYGGRDAVSRIGGPGLFPFERSHYLSGIRFLRPWWDEGPPLAQEILEPGRIPDEWAPVQPLLEKAYAEPGALTSHEWLVVAAHAGLRSRYYFGSVFTDFGSPFQDCLFYGPWYINTKHPVSHILLKLDLVLSVPLLRASFSKAALGCASDALGDIRHRIIGSLGSYEAATAALTAFLQVINESGILAIPDAAAALGSGCLFVPGTERFKANDFEVPTDALQKGGKLFGQVLTSWPE